MLSPLGTLIIKFNQNPTSSAENKNSLEFEDEDNVRDAMLHPSSLSTGEDGEEIDLEDQINAPDTNSSEPPTPSSMYLTIEAQDGTEKRVHKAHALKVLFQEIVNEKGSTDQQKHIQGLTHYSIKPTNTLDSPGSDDSIFGESICVGDPAITLVVVE